MAPYPRTAGVPHTVALRRTRCASGRSALMGLAARGRPIAHLAVWLVHGRRDIQIRPRVQFPPSLYKAETPISPEIEANASRYTCAYLPGAIHMRRETQLISEFFLFSTAFGPSSHMPPSPSASAAVGIQRFRIAFTASGQSHPPPGAPLPCGPGPPRLYLPI